MVSGPYRTHVINLFLGRASTTDELLSEVLRDEWGYVQDFVRTGRQCCKEGL